MEEENYYLISISEDGDIRVDVVKPDVLLAEINAEEDGIPADSFGDHIEDTDPNYWKHRHLLIKGRIVVPEPKERVVKYTLE